MSRFSMIARSRSAIHHPMAAMQKAVHCRHWRLLGRVEIVAIE
jgi:hypothetical protein